MIGFLSWQAAVGIFIAGVIVGWFLSIGTAYRIAKKHNLWVDSIEQDSHWHHD